MMKLSKRSTKMILLLQQVFILSAFGLLTIRNGELDWLAAGVGLALCVFNLLQYNILKVAFRHLDRFVLLAAQFLWSVGLIVIYRIRADYAIKQGLILMGSTIVAVVVMLIIRNSKDFGKWNWVFMLLAIALLGSTLVLSRTIGGAKNWIDLGIFSFQPSEFAKILFIMGSAYFLSTREKLFSFIPYIGFTGICVVLLVAAKELGTGLLLCGTFLILFFAATGRVLLTLLGVGVFGAGAYASYHIFSHVRTRVEVWLDPWASYNDQGYQIVQGLMALASGGLFGVGLGNGMPGVIPASHTDYIFSVIGEEFGILFAGVVIVFYLVFIVRGMLIALNAENTYDALLVFGCTCMLSLQGFIIIGGVIKLIPLTGITLPFVSYGGSSLLSSMIQLGIIEGVAIKNGKREEKELRMMGAEL
jgi:cell division protein FtsW (lipid II flippase)